MAAFRYIRGSATLAEIDRRARCGSEAWYRLHPREAVRWLSAWRRDHMSPIGGGKDAHAPVRSFARKKGLKPSSLLTVKESLAFQAKKLGKSFSSRATERQLGQIVSS